MRRMLSFAFSMSSLLDNEDVLVRQTDAFLDAIRDVRSEDGKKGMNIVQKLNYVTFNIMGEMSFGDSWDLRLGEQIGWFNFCWSELLSQPLQNTALTGRMSL